MLVCGGRGRTQWSWSLHQLCLATRGRQSRYFTREHPAVVIAPRSLARCFSSANSAGGGGGGDYKKEVEAITAKFFEARELLADARDSLNSKYFNEDYKEAEQAVQDVLQHYQSLMDRLSTADKQAVQTSIGMRVQELQAEFQQLQHSLREA